MLNAQKLCLTLPLPRRRPLENTAPGPVARSHGPRSVPILAWGRGGPGHRLYRRSRLSRTTVVAGPWGLVSTPDVCDLLRRYLCCVRRPQERIAPRHRPDIVHQHVKKATIRNFLRMTSPARWSTVARQAPMRSYERRQPSSACRISGSLLRSPRQRARSC